MAHAETILEAPFAPTSRPRWFGSFRFFRLSTGRARRLKTSVPRMDAHMMRDIGLTPDAHWHQDPTLKATRILYGIQG